MYKYMKCIYICISMSWHSMIPGPRVVLAPSFALGVGDVLHKVFVALCRIVLHFVATHMLHCVALCCIVLQCHFGALLRIWHLQHAS